VSKKALAAYRLKRTISISIPTAHPAATIRLAFSDGKTVGAQQNKQYNRSQFFHIHSP